jgi:hypothetical protein
VQKDFFNGYDPNSTSAPACQLPDMPPHEAMREKCHLQTLAPALSTMDESHILNYTD